MVLQLAGTSTSTNNTGRRLVEVVCITGSTSTGTPTGSTVLAAAAHLPLLLLLLVSFTWCR
jgi:hypothetical protein